MLSFEKNININSTKDLAKFRMIFGKISKKNCPSESKKGIRDFFPKQHRGVITPSWRKMGTQKCHHFSEQIALFCCIKFRFANFNTFIKNKFKNFKKRR